jgi:predicted DNA-binding mobile mystery protein A
MSKLYNIMQLDKKLSPKLGIFMLRVPHGGWIKTIRTAIGMTGLQLAQRAQLSSRRIAAIEQAEVEQKLKLETLTKIADALGCDLHYVLTPKAGGSFLQQVQARAMQKARHSIKTSGLHMSLEDQQAPQDMQDQAQVLAQELLHTNLKGLWDD